VQKEARGERFLSCEGGECPAISQPARERSEPLIETL
jgi:hypothetical protein